MNRVTSVRLDRVGLGVVVKGGIAAWLAMGWLVMGSVSAAESLVTWRTDSAEFTVDRTGRLTSMFSVRRERELVPKGEAAPLVSLRVEGKWHSPEEARWEAGTGRLTLRYPAVEGEVVVGTWVKPTHWTLEVLEARCVGALDLVLWGPYPTTIGRIIGETVGVVRDGEVAVGIQALNPKTLGGYPTQENDITSGYTADDAGGYADLPAELAKDQGYRSDTAIPKPYGSALQAYCRNRDRDREIENWGQARYLAPAYDDGGVVGSRIALFVGEASAALETLGAIEVAEGLPHPIIDGEWGKTARRANESYLIVDFGEGTLERALEMTRRAGLRYLYHSSPFETWGHFRLKPSLFPNGVAGLRACVERAGSAGVRIGVHTLSNFITPNDAYVTPRPDRRLARIGAGSLSGSIDGAQREIGIRDPALFRNDTALNGVRIGDELIRYKAVSTNAPWRLLECERGAWGTAAVAHGEGSAVERLMDHGYNVFLSDADLAREMAVNIARLCNETGIRQLSFDGLEGNWSTGMGQYGRTLFTVAWYDALSERLRGQVINDASNPGHYNWHIYTRMNWGEPWYAGFRESQTLYRFRNQLYFERNLMPRMLGWFALRPDTSLEDAEWLLARAAGFNAGFALASSLASTAQLEADPGSAEAARQSGSLLPILELIRQWETARMSDAFPDEIRAALRDNTREFHLEGAGPGAWNLREAYGTRGVATDGRLEVSWVNPAEGQPLQWVLRNTAKTAVSGLEIRVNERRVVRLGEREIPAGGVVRYGGGSDVTIGDGAWREKERVAVDVAAAGVARGWTRIEVVGAGGRVADLKLERRTLGPVTELHAARGR